MNTTSQLDSESAGCPVSYLPAPFSLCQAKRTDTCQQIKFKREFKWKCKFPQFFNQKMMCHTGKCMFPGGFFLC